MKSVRSSGALVAIVASLVSATAATKDIRTCCDLLQDLGPLVTYPNQDAYGGTLNGYFAAQESSLHPACIVLPQNTEDVAKTVKLLAGAKIGSELCQFAVKGGGHGLNKGAANIDGPGITISLEKMNQVEVKASPAGTYASIGPGSNWDKVYKTLELNSLSTPGGRVASVGVPGLLTGGGLSFLSPRLGFVCDNVRNFEVVLASGQVVNANAAENPLLFRALKGGSNNFGVVTRFDVETVKNEVVDSASAWGGSIQYAPSYAEQVTRLFANFNDASHYDIFASMIQNYIYVAPNAVPGLTNAFDVIDNELVYTRPLPRGAVRPAVYGPWVDDIKDKYKNTLANRNLTSITEEVGGDSASNKRVLYRSITVQNNFQLLFDAYKLWNASRSQGPSTTEGFINVLTYHPLPRNITGHATADGDNALGLRNRKTDLAIVQIGLTWNSIEDDERLTKYADSYLADVNKLAQERNLYDPFIYLNYAGPRQDPISGYGQDSKKALRSASHKYDQNKVFQKQVPGGFKLF